MRREHRNHRPSSENWNAESSGRSNSTRHWIPASAGKTRLDHAHWFLSGMTIIIVFPAKAGIQEFRHFGQLEINWIHYKYKQIIDLGYDHTSAGTERCLLPCIVRGRIKEGAIPASLCNDLSKNIFMPALCRVFI